MSSSGSIKVADLQAWLDHVSRPETMRLLLAAIAVESGIDPSKICSWYDLDREDLDDWMASLHRDSLTRAIAEQEGVRFNELARTSGLTTTTVSEWFANLDNRPIEEAADIIARYSARQPKPLLSTTSSRVHYLDYEAVLREGWSLDDPDLFELAADADLDHEEYGRVLVEPNQTILEAVEARGLSWPFACRGGACANCAVLVLEGDIAMPGQTVLTDEQVREANARLTCVGVPVTEEIKLVMNAQALESFDHLRLPAPMASLE